MTTQQNPIVELLRQIVFGTEPDPEERLAELSSLGPLSVALGGPAGAAEGAGYILP